MEIQTNERVLESLEKKDLAFLSEIIDKFQSFSNTKEINDPFFNKNNGFYDNVYTYEYNSTYLMYFDKKIDEETKQEFLYLFHLEPKVK